MHVDLRSRLRRAKAWLVFGGSFSLRPHEARCVQEWGATLNAEGRLVLDEQMRMLDRYKRSGNDRVVSFYSTLVPNGEHLPDAIRFRLREDESRVATVHMVYGGVKASVKASIVLTAGELLSIEFSKEPREFAEHQLHDVRVDTHRDVMARAPESRELPVAPGLQALLGEAANRARKVRAPLTDSHRNAIPAGLNAELPSAYLRLTEPSDGFQLGRLRLYGLAEVWSAPRPNGVFLVIGAVDEEADLAVKDGEEGGTVYWLSYEGDEPRPLGSDLSTLVTRYASE